jgi:hypothetical protein
MTERSEIFQKIKQIAMNGYMEMILLKTTGSIKPEKMRELYRVTVDGEIVTHFRSLVQRKMDWLNNDSDLSFIDFFEDTASDHYICTLNDLTDIPILSPVITKIKQGSYVNTIPNFSETALDKLHSYAIEIKQGTERIIYFRKYGKGSKISSKGLALILKRGKFNKLDGDVFKIDDTVDCIYYEWEGQVGIYIINRENFESIFSFYEIYRMESQTAQSILSASNIVVIAEGLFESIINTRRYAKKVSLINRRGNFNDIDLPNIQQLITRSQNHLKFKIREGKIVIQNKEELKDFLDVCDNNILQHPFNPATLFRAKNKERL